MEKYGRARETTDDNVIGRIKALFACRITKAKIHRQSLYLLIIAFPRQQFLRERA